MELDLTPKSAEPLFEGDGGGYYTWYASQMPILATTNLGAGRFLLHPRGFAFPHYADSSKVGYVIQGSDGVVGMVLPDGKEEVVLKLEQGDVIAVPVGAVSWWFNDGDTDLDIVFLGETSKVLIPGQFTYFLLTGALGVIGGFSTELTSKVYNFDKDEVQKLTKSQADLFIVKLDKNQALPKPQIDITKKLVCNIDAACAENVVEKAGLVKTLTEKEFSFMGEIGLSLIRVKLEADAIKAPSYPTTAAIQLIYIARGSGKIEIVDFNGKSALDTLVKAGDLIVVPQLFVVAKIAGEETMECYSITTTTKFADDAIEDWDGNVYFSIVSTKFDMHHWHLDFLEARPHGQLFKYTAKSNESVLLLDNLAFANGVALSKDQDFLLICETWRYRCLRYWLKGEKKGKTDIFVENLPGAPDNINLAPDGSFWIGLIQLNSERLEFMYKYKITKHLLAASPRLFNFVADLKRRARVVNVGTDGKIIRKFEDGDGKVINFVTSALEFEEHLYLGSLSSNFVGKLPLHAA